MMRIAVLAVVAALVGIGPLLGPRRAPAVPFSVVEQSIADMQAAMRAGHTTSRAITQQYLDRIARYDPQLHAAITVNPRALDEADERDRERASGRVRGPLHGIPIAVKDNIQTTDMRTTGGALAFASFLAPYEATLVSNLRAAGVVIIAKTTMTELANWIAADMPNTYNAVRGYGVNPYDPLSVQSGGEAPGVLDTGGSSSGAGTAANLWAASVGSETSGSILSPSTLNMLVGIKPTVGRVSRHGMIPITLDQDTAGPMARTVADAAVLLQAMAGSAPDPFDAATTGCPRLSLSDVRRALRSNALRGRRVGVPRAHFHDRLGSAAVRVVDESLAALRRVGAVIVDPTDIPSIVASAPEDNLLAWDICSGSGGARGRDGSCSVVLKYGTKRDFGRWLQTLGRAAPVASLGALRAWNRDHAAEGALRFGQAQLDNSDEVDLEADRARYEADRARDLRLAATQGIDAVLRDHRLDALLFPGAHGADIAARAGYPTVIVPAGLTQAPEGGGAITGRVSPLGLSFTGPACSEATLIGYAYAFEQATRRRVPPPAFP